MPAVRQSLQPVALLGWVHDWDSEALVFQHRDCRDEGEGRCLVGAEAAGLRGINAPYGRA